MPCVGLGQQRYKFQDESHKFPASNTPARTVDNLITLHQEPLAIQVPRNPSNSMTALVSALVHKVELTPDINYQLRMNFGGYLDEIPRRLGSNAALDAASAALIAAHTNYCSSGCPRLEQELLTRHSHALTVLRETLNDPVRTQSSETLCAILVLSIVQVREQAFLLLA